MSSIWSDSFKQDISLSNAAGLILPATATLLPARSQSCPVKAVVVVFPLVPVMANTTDE